MLGTVTMIKVCKCLQKPEKKSRILFLFVKVIFNERQPKVMD